MPPTTEVRRPSVYAFTPSRLGAMPALIETSRYQVEQLSSALHFGTEWRLAELSEPEKIHAILALEGVQAWFVYSFQAAADGLVEALRQTGCFRGLFMIGSGRQERLLDSLYRASVASIELHRSLLDMEAAFASHYEEQRRALGSLVQAALMRDTAGIRELEMERQRHNGKILRLLHEKLVA